MQAGRGRVRAGGPQPGGRARGGYHPQMRSRRASACGPRRRCAWARGNGLATTDLEQVHAELVRLDELGDGLRVDVIIVDLGQELPQLVAGLLPDRHGGRRK